MESLGVVYGGGIARVGASMYTTSNSTKLTKKTMFRVVIKCFIFEDLLHYHNSKTSKPIILEVYVPLH